MIWVFGPYGNLRRPNRRTSPIVERTKGHAKASAKFAGNLRIKIPNCSTGTTPNTSRGMTLTAVGVVIGVGGAIALTRLMHSLLFNTSTTDPFVFILISALLSLAAFFACYLPARRAARVDPLIALRYE